MHIRSLFLNALHLIVTLFCMRKCFSVSVFRWLGRLGMGVQGFRIVLAAQLFNTSEQMCKRAKTRLFVCFARFSESKMKPTKDALSATFYFHQFDSKKGEQLFRKHMVVI